MDFNEIENRLKAGFEQPLPGLNAQLLMAPEGRKMREIDIEKENLAKKAGVMALFYKQQNSARLILTLRNRYPGVHSNQVSFPGGKREEQDRDFLDTALRETREEIGLETKQLNVMGALSPIYIPPSNFLVHPYVGLYPEPPFLKKQESEVAEIFSVDAEDLLSDRHISSIPLDLGGYKATVPVFRFNGHDVWGATAMMISELRQLLLQST